MTNQEPEAQGYQPPSTPNQEQSTQEGDSLLSPDALSYLDAFAENLEPPPEPPGPPPEKCTDLGNARRLVRNHGRDIRYCHIWGKWLAWNDRRWEVDENGEIMRRAKETSISIYREVARAANEDERKTMARWALASEAASRMKAMIELAQSEPGIPVAPGELDADDWILNVKNGILDLRTGKLLPHAREAMLTKLAPVEYAPETTCPVWLAFLERIMDGNQELISFLQRAVGYALTGDTREEVIFLLYGTGANGKSTFLETMQGLLGDYARQADFSTFLLKQNETVRNDLARLAGVRLVSAIELEAGKRLSESVVKQVTGRDTVTARFLFREYFEYRPKMKIFLACNHKPVIKGNDHAIWRRIRLIPFNVTIPDEEQDKDLDRKLRTELPGIFAWAVQGCLDWQEHGLGTPGAVQDATEEYREEMDVLGEFLVRRCLVGDGLRAFSSDLYRAYLDWAQDTGIRKPMSQTMFGSRLSERGFTRKKSTGGNYAWLGIGVKSAYVDDGSEADDNEYSCNKWKRKDEEYAEIYGWTGDY